MKDRFDLKQDVQFEKIYGGVGWPGKRPGFGVVVGQKKEWRLGGRDLVVLDEFEEGDTRKLVRRLGGLDFHYRPNLWIGETKNAAADKFIREMNRETDPRQGGRDLRMRRTRLLDMDNLFEYAFPTLKELFQPERRRLFLEKGKLLRQYLGQPQETDLREIRLGDYPAIEALMYVALELEQEMSPSQMPRQKYARNNLRFW